MLRGVMSMGYLPAVFTMQLHVFAKKPAIYRLQLMDCVRIFFDWEHDGTCKHVGIVERCDGETVYTIEGNSGDVVKERSYAIRSDSIMGYGMVGY